MIKILVAGHHSHLANHCDREPTEGLRECYGEESILFSYRFHPAPLCIVEHPVLGGIPGSDGAYEE